VLGLGPIGRSVAKEIARAPDLRLVGAVDPAPAIAGRDLGSFLSEGSLEGMKVVPDLDALPRRRADVAVHMAASRFLQAVPHLDALIGRGLHVVSTCEEMIAASARWPRECRALDRRARKAGVAVLAAGVNPGFVMDLLPAAMSNICLEVRSVRVTRHVDTSKRRPALQAKTGAGITTAEFRRRAKRNEVGHVGLRDSLLFLMGHLPLEGDVGEERLRPIVAKRPVGKGKRRIEAGRVLGVHHSVKAESPSTGKVVATLELKMAYGLAEPFDEIRIAGDPPLHLRFEGGVSGDRATVGSVLSTIRFTDGAAPGLGG
jgi:4-hydroxy-tetrahydrodipicolinate reductase